MQTTYAFVDVANIVHGQWRFLRLGNHREGSDLPLVFEKQLSRKINTLKRCLDSTVEFILVLDEHSIRKKSLYVDYKANHGPHGVPVREAAEYLVDRFRLKVCVSRGNEADDTIATLCQLNPGFSIIISGDQDLWQCMGPRTTIFNPILKRFIEEKDVRAKYGDPLRPHHVPLAKALWGDAGDNILPAVPYTRKHLLGHVGASDGSVEDLCFRIMMAWDDLSEKIRIRWMHGEDKVKLNFELVKLDTKCKIIWGKEALLT